MKTTLALTWMAVQGAVDHLAGGERRSHSLSHSVISFLEVPAFTARLSPAGKNEL